MMAETETGDTLLLFDVDETRDTLLLFDVDGTLTPSRLVRYFARGLCANVYVCSCVQMESCMRLWIEDACVRHL